MTRRSMPIRFVTVTVFIGILLVFLLSFFIIRTIQTQRSLPNRIGIVIVGSPYRVILWDRMRGAFTSFIIPDDAIVDVTHGYGRLPLRSLQSLDHMEKQQGRLIRESVADAVGFPIDFHIISNDERENDEERSVLRHVFSFGKMIQSFLSHKETNIPWMTFVSVSRSASIVSNQSVSSFSVDTPGILVESVDLSGSSVRDFNPSAFDSRVGSRFEDPDIASERLSVSLFNATDRPGLAQNAGRLMEKSGVHVVSIGNSEEVGEGLCVVETGKKQLNTNTVRFIQRTLGCSVREASSEGQQSDVRVVLFVPWADRYQPVKK